MLFRSWRFGTEHEKLGLYADDYTPVRYEGERGIGALFAKLIHDHGFEPLLQGEVVVGLEQGQARITLESIGEGVITTDRNGTIDYMNEAAEQLIGGTRAAGTFPASKRSRWRSDRRPRLFTLGTIFENSR